MTINVTGDVLSVEGYLSFGVFCVLQIFCICISKLMKITMGLSKRAAFRDGLLEQNRSYQPACLPMLLACTFVAQGNNKVIV